MHSSFLLLGVLTGLTIVYHTVKRIQLHFRRRAFKKAHGCLPPASSPKIYNGILGISIVRENHKNAKDGRFLECSQQRFAKYGSTFTARIMGERAILTIDKENIKTVLNDRFQDFVLKREQSLGWLFGIGIFTSDGETWKHSRAMIKPNFDRRQVANLDMFERHVAALNRCIPKDGATVDLQELFFRLTIDSATEFLFGHSVESLSGAGDKEVRFAKAFNESMHAVVSRARLGSMAFLFRDKKADEAARICYDFIDEFVDDALKSVDSPDVEKVGGKLQYIFSHELAKATKDRRRLRDEIFNVLLAGRDTTASLLSNLFFVLAKNPEIWQKIVNEVKESLQGARPTFEQLKEMKYLQACMSESLRYHPVVPGNGRFAIRDTWLPLGGGPDGKSPLFVPAGTRVGYSPWSMHRRKDYYGDDAEEFRPERWETLRQNWQYLPFNGGPRICLGQQYALTEAGYAIARIAQEFGENGYRLESRDPGPWVEGLTLTLASRNGAKVAFVKE